MNVNELMVGDIIRFKHINGNGTTDPHEITCIDGFNNEIHADGEIYDLRFWNIEPIPLTPEILEKNGFEKWDGWYIHSLENFGIEIAFVGTILKIGGECGTLELPAIMYIHQLQHALKLCRIKMEIEL